MNTAEHHRAPQDVPFKPAGAGLTIRARCMGCDQPRLQAGGKGKPGPRWRCSVCVAAKRVGAAA